MKTKGLKVRQSLPLLKPGAGVVTYVSVKYPKKLPYGLGVHVVVKYAGEIVLKGGCTLKRIPAMIYGPGT